MTEQRQDGWHIVGVPEIGSCGPYSTKAEAEDDRRGLARFYRYEIGTEPDGDVDLITSAAGDDER